MNWTEARPEPGVWPTPRNTIETPGAEVPCVGALLPQAAPRKTRLVGCRARLCCLRLMVLRPLPNVVSWKPSTVAFADMVPPRMSSQPPRKVMFLKTEPAVVLMRPVAKLTAVLSRRRVEPTSRKTRERQEPLASTSTVPCRISRPLVFWSMTSVTLEDSMRRVPAPSFSTELKRVAPPKLISVLPRTMSPLAASIRVLLPTVFWMPP